MIVITSVRQVFIGDGFEVRGKRGSLRFITYVSDRSVIESDWFSKVINEDLDRFLSGVV